MKRKHNFYYYLIILVLVLVAIIMLYPFWHEFMYSFSDPVEGATGGMFLLPRGFNLKSYWSVLRNQSVWSGFKVSLIVTIIGTIMGFYFLQCWPIH